MSKLKVTTPTENTVRYERFFAARPENVFKAYTDPDMMLKWFSTPDSPLKEVTSDFRQGGAFKYVWESPDPAGMVMRGKWVELDPPNFIKSTENWDEDWTGGEVINTVEFQAKDGGTLLVLTSTYSSREARDGAMPAAEGFEICLENLAELLAEPTPA